MTGATASNTRPVSTANCGGFLIALFTRTRYIKYIAIVGLMMLNVRTYSQNDYDKIFKKLQKAKTTEEQYEIIQKNQSRKNSILTSEETSSQFVEVIRYSAKKEGEIELKNVGYMAHMIRLNDSIYLRTNGGLLSWEYPINRFPIYDDIKDKPLTILRSVKPTIEALKFTNNMLYHQYDTTVSINQMVRQKKIRITISDGNGKYYYRCIYSQATIDRITGRLVDGYVEHIFYPKGEYIDYITLYYEAPNAENAPSDYQRMLSEGKYLVYAYAFHDARNITLMNLKRKLDRIENLLTSGYENEGGIMEGYWMLVEETQNPYPYNIEENIRIRQLTERYDQEFARYDQQRGKDKDKMRKDSLDLLSACYSGKVDEVKKYIRTHVPGRYVSKAVEVMLEADDIAQQVEEIRNSNQSDRCDRMRNLRAKAPFTLMAIKVNGFICNCTVDETIESRDLLMDGRIYKLLDEELKLIEKYNGDEYYTRIKLTIAREYYRKLDQYLVDADIFGKAHGRYNQDIVMERHMDESDFSTTQFLIYEDKYYFGKTILGAPNGLGIIMNDGTKPPGYFGGFLDGVPSGYGEAIVKGSRYRGYLKSGLMHGYGELVGDNFEFRGEHDMGALTKGEGRLLMDNGSEYIGNIENNVPHGMGMLVTPEGTVAGEMKNGEPVGVWDLTDNSGERLKVEWRGKTMVPVKDASSSGVSANVSKGNASANSGARCRLDMGVSGVIVVPVDNRAVCCWCGDRYAPYVTITAQSMKASAEDSYLTELLIYHLVTEKADNEYKKACYEKYSRVRGGNYLLDAVSVPLIELQVSYGYAKTPSKRQEVNQYEMRGKLCGSGQCRAESERYNQSVGRGGQKVCK